jgi:hypothetical protein
MKSKLCLLQKIWGVPVGYWQEGNLWITIAFVSWKQGENAVFNSLNYKFEKSSRPDRHVKVYRSSDVSGTDSVPNFRVLIKSQSQKRRKICTHWRGCLPEKTSNFIAAKTSRHVNSILIHNQQQSISHSRLVLSSLLVLSPSCPWSTYVSSAGQSVFIYWLANDASIIRS